MAACVQQQHRGMAPLLLIDNTQIVASAYGAQSTQFAGQSMILQGRMKGLVHEYCQRRLYPMLITHG